MKKILVVVDMQNDFIDGVLGTPEAQTIVPNVVKKIKKYNEADDLVLFTKDTHYDNYLVTQEGKNLPVPHCIINTNGWCINKSVRSEWLNSPHIEIRDDMIEENNTIFKSAFGSILLGEFLEELITLDVSDEIDEIEFVGVCTDICVISNAMITKAFLPDIKITVDANCCAGVTPESHKTALEAMKACQINVVNY